jgi:hypothetical protein
MGKTRTGTTPTSEVVKKHKTQRQEILTAAEIRFCQYVFSGMSGMAACAKAFPHYTESSLETVPGRLLREDRIRDYIRALQDQATSVARVTVEKLVRSAEQSGWGSRVLIFDDDGHMLPPKQWPEWLQIEVQGLEVTERTDRETGEKITTYKMKFSKASEARDMLAKWLGMLDKDKDKDAGQTQAAIVQMPAKELIPEDVL